MNTASDHQPFVFSPPAAPVSQPADQTRREVTQILRELADANRSPLSRPSYVRLLADRVLRCIAAQGVIVWWSHTRSDRYDVEHRLGVSTDSDWTTDERATHDRLMREVATTAAPVVVPPTPGACSADVPANPSSSPAALVPLIVDPMASFPIGWLEVFLQEGSDTATQRGTLRFLAQVADLAGEFFRVLQLRQQHEILRCNDQIDSFAASLNRVTRTQSIEARWVDELAEVGPWARVALCRFDMDEVRVAAVGHVASIDQYGAAAASIRRAAAVEIPSTRSSSAPNIAWDEASSSAAFGDEPLAWEHELVVHRVLDAEKGIAPRLVVALTPRSKWRVVLCDPSESEIELDGVARHRLRRLLHVGEQAWNGATRLESIPGGRWWADRMTEDDSADQTDPVIAPRKIKRRRLVRWLVTSTAVAGLAICPVPSNVSCRGTIQPAQMESHHAPIDASVETVHVAHGQWVPANEPLLTLRSADLNDRRTTLLGRQAVLQQRRTQWKQSLVKTGSVDADQGQIDGGQIDEEIASIQSQLAIIDQTQDALTIRSRNEGTVDAWQIEQLTVGRPVRRGDPLIRVVDQNAGWVVDARVAQRRVPMVRSAMQSETLTAKVLLEGEPESPIVANVDRFGPTTNDPLDGTPAILLRCRLEPSMRDQDRLVSNLPARISIGCGSMSLGWFLLQDIWSMTRTWIGMIR